MFQEIFRNAIKVESSIKKISPCDIYNSINISIDDELNKILLTERVRKESRKKIRNLYFKNKLFTLYFAMKLNAKFRFKFFKFSLEIIHLYLESYRLFAISKKKSYSDFLEINRFKNVQNSLMFTPSLKSYLLVKRNIAFSKRKKKLLFSKKRAYSNKFILSKSKMQKYIYYLPIILLENAIVFSGVSSISLGGTMNIFNRILALIAIENDIKVIIKDHGFVRDCCAESAIFSEHRGFNKDSLRAKKEAHLIVNKI